MVESGSRELSWVTEGACLAIIPRTLTLPSAADLKMHGQRGDGG